MLYMGRKPPRPATATLRTRAIYRETLQFGCTSRAKAQFEQKSGIKCCRLGKNFAPSAHRFMPNQPKKLATKAASTSPEDDAYSPEKADVDVDLLDFDPENPRFFSEADDLSDLEVVGKMLDEEKVLELVLSIGEKGYYEGEPLLLVPNSKRVGRFIVVEGNRRLAALKILTQPKIAAELKRKVINRALEEINEDKLPKTIPCLKFRRRQDTLEYLGFRHITGAKPWGPLAKAKFLNQLRATLPRTMSKEDQLNSLAKTIGSYPKTVRELLVAYAIYETIEKAHFFGIEGLRRDTLEFGVFYTALKDKTILEFIGKPENPDNVKQSLKLAQLEELTAWIYEKKEDPLTLRKVTRLGESRNLVSLSRIMRNDHALNAFRSGATLRSAAGMAGEQLEVFEKACSASLENLKQANSLVNEVGDKLEQSQLRLVSTAFAEAEDLHERVRKKVRTNEKTER